jgi:hypothetical protein
VNNMQQLAEIVRDKTGQLEDAHCCLIMVCTISTQAEFIKTCNNISWF